MLLLPCLLTVMMKFLFCVSHRGLLCFLVMVTMLFLSCAPVFLAFPPPPSLLLFALDLPRRLAAVANALMGMVNTDLLLLLLLRDIQILAGKLVCPGRQKVHGTVIDVKHIDHVSLAYRI
jgi:hypothetical protein